MININEYIEHPDIASEFEPNAKYKKFEGSLEEIEIDIHEPIIIIGDKSESASTVDNLLFKVFKSNKKRRKGSSEVTILSESIEPTMFGEYLI